MLPESIIQPRYFFTTTENLWSQKIIWLLVSQSEAQPNHQFSIVTPKFNGDLGSIVENGIYIFDCVNPDHKGNIRFIYGKNKIPEVFGSKSNWGVAIYSSALLNLEKAANDIASSFYPDNFQKMAQLDCFPWGQPKRRLIA